MIERRFDIQSIAERNQGDLITGAGHNQWGN
jgi:hypothetical protein